MNRAALLLLLLGCSQMAGDLLGLPRLRGLAAATAASPAPRVFASARGLETYSTRFLLEWTNRRGTTHTLRLSPEIYSRLEGPYNRRNVYAAALAYGPVLVSEPATKPLFEAVFRYGLCGNAPLLRELGVDPASVRGPRRVRLEPRAGSDTGDLPLLLEVNCP